MISVWDPKTGPPTEENGKKSCRRKFLRKKTVRSTRSSTPAVSSGFQNAAGTFPAKCRFLNCLSSFGDIIQNTPHFAQPNVPCYLFPSPEAAILPLGQKHKPLTVSGLLQTLAGFRVIVSETVSKLKNARRWRVVSRFLRHSWVNSVCSALDKWFEPRSRAPPCFLSDIRYVIPTIQ